MFVNHAHILPAEVREDATLESFLRLADIFGFEGGVLFAPFHGFVNELGIEPNQWLAKQLSTHDNLVGFGILDPKLSAPKQIEMFVELGFKGVKLHPAVQGFHLFGDWAKEAYASMVEHKLIANFHTGIHCHEIETTCDPVHFDSIAQHFPDLRLVLDHVGGWHFFREMVGVIVNNRARTNVYAGITSVLDAEFQRYWYLGAEGIQDLKWQVGPDLMIYGLDFPYNTEKQIRRDIDLINSLDWSSEDREALLGTNLKRLLGLVEGKARTVGGDPKSR